jgi:endoglucanase
VYLGIIAWAAGSFSTSYTLSLTPTKQNGKFVDNKLASQCVVSVWLNAPTAVVTSAVVSVTSSRVETSTSASAVESATVIQSSGSVASSKSVAAGTSTTVALTQTTASSVQTINISGTASASPTLAVATTGLATESTNSSGNAAGTGDSTSSGAVATPTFQISGATVTSHLRNSFGIGLCGLFVFLSF